MTVPCVTLNELSVAVASDGSSADERGIAFAQLTKRLRAFGFGAAVRTTSDALDRQFSPSQTLRNWIVTPRSSDMPGAVEAKRLLGQLLQKGPFVDVEMARLETGACAAYEFRFEGRLAPGMGFAHLVSGPCVSFAGNPEFSKPEVSITALEVTSSESDERVVFVKHFAAASDVSGHAAWLGERIQEAYTNGVVLCAACETIFPQLKLCESARAQINGLGGGEDSFKAIVRHLYVLSTAAALWESGTFSPSIPFSPESASTLQNPHWAKMRTFRCPDGTERLFTLHSKIGGHTRIHFYWHHPARHVLVGYVGAHLPTSSDPT